MYIKKRKNFTSILLVEGAIILFLLMLFLYQYKNGTIISSSLADWKSGYIVYNGEGWYIDERYFAENQEAALPVELVKGPDIFIPKGSYTVDINYVAEEDQIFRTGNSDFIRSSDAILSKNRNSVRYHFTATENIEHFNLSFRYNGQGILGIQDVTIKEDTAQARRNIVLVVFLFAIFDSCILFSVKEEEKRTIWILIGVTLLASLPVMRNGIYCDRNDDLMFHLMRIEGIACEIRNGNIPVRIASLWMDGYGYPASVYYGDILLYIPAVLRLAGFAVTTCYISYVLMINAGTTIISYLCFKKIFRVKKIAYFLSLLFVTSSYRLTNIYIRGAVGEYSALMFFPVIAMAIHGIYAENPFNRKADKKNALFLALGMTGLIESHILSTEMTVFILILICLVLWKKTFCFHTMKVYITAVVITVLLNMAFIVPFLDYFFHVSTKINQVDPLHTYPLAGIPIGGLFSFFLYNGKYLFTPGLVLMSGFLMAICYIYQNRKKQDAELCFYAVFSAILLFIASSFFPWKNLVQNFKLWRILAQVQFPFRYIGIATIFLTLLSGKLIHILSKKYPYRVNKLLSVFSAISIMSTLHFCSNIYNMPTTIFYDTAELNTKAVIGGEYLPADAERQAQEHYVTGKVASHGVKEAAVLSRNGLEICLYCETADQEGTVEVPLFNYKGYHVFDDKGAEYEIHNGENFTIGFTLPARFEGTVTVKFIEPWCWRAAEVISFITFLVLAVRFPAGRRDLCKS